LNFEKYSAPNNLSIFKYTVLLSDVCWYNPENVIYVSPVGLTNLNLNID